MATYYMLYKVYNKEDKLIDAGIKCQVNAFNEEFAASNILKELNKKFKENKIDLEIVEIYKND